MMGVGRLQCGGLSLSRAVVIELLMASRREPTMMGVLMGSSKVPPMVSMMGVSMNSQSR